MNIDGPNRTALSPNMLNGPRATPDISVVKGGRLTPKLSGPLVPADQNSAGAAVRSLVRDMAATPPVNGSKVSALKSAIAAGTYTVQPEKLADAMIRLTASVKF